MLRELDDLAIRFNEIENGEATKDDCVEYELSIKASCMNETTLRLMIEERAKELKS